MKKACPKRSLYLLQKIQMNKILWILYLFYLLEDCLSMILNDDVDFIRYSDTHGVGDIM